jgi:hypothetical protein
LIQSLPGADPAPVSAAVTFHHETGTPTRDVGDDGGTPMQLGHDAETDRKGELHGLAGAQTQVTGFDEHAACAQVLSTTQAPLLSG